MEDLFYNEYAKALQKKNLGRFSRRQMFVCWSLWTVLAISGIGVFSFSILKSKGWFGVCIGIYTLFAILLELALARFENLRRLSLFSQDCDTRISCVKGVIDRYLKVGRYDEKIKFLLELYDKAVKQREAREKSFRRAGIATLSAIGVVVSNVANSPENTVWQAVLYAGMSFVLVFGLAVVPYFFKGAFDSKKKMYSFMTVELQAVKLMMHEEKDGLTEINNDNQNMEQSAINQANTVRVEKKKQKQTRKKRFRE